MPAESPGKIAAANVIAAAGDASEAVQGLLDVVKSHPDDGDALEYCCDTLRDYMRYADVEKIAREWLARRPGDIRAHVQLVVTLFARNDKEGAQHAMAAFRKAAPNDRDAHDYLDTMYRSRFGGAPDPWGATAEGAPLEGAPARERRASDAFADKRSISEEIVEGEFARRMGDDSAELAASLALLCFRSFRFEKCRKYARLALEKRPGMPAPTELLYLSWLVLFPPFLLAQVYLFLWFKLQRASLVGQFLGYFIAVTVGIFPVTWSYVLLTALMDAAGLPVYATLACALAWAAYAPFIGSLAPLVMRQSPKHISLGDY